MAENDGADDAAQDAIVIKKYANRRLYNTATSSYVTLDHLCQMVRDGEDFIVRDAKSGDDITHQVLTQIIVEQEAKGQNLLPSSFLRQMIRLYDDNLQAFVPRYLELAMESFTRNQGDMRAQMEKAFGGMFPVNDLDAIRKHNVELVQRTMEMFTPFGRDGAEQASAGKNREEAGDLDALLEKLNEMQAQLDALTRGSQKGRRGD
jgi:polyhydroxyalkanoate synthesis repressor PhaR